MWRVPDWILFGRNFIGIMIYPKMKRVINLFPTLKFSKVGVDLNKKGSNERQAYTIFNFGKHETIFCEFSVVLDLSQIFKFWNSSDHFTNPAHLISCFKI